MADESGRESVEALLRSWIDGWARLAQAQGAAAQALGSESGEIEAEALWSALAAQAALWREAAERAASGARSRSGADALARLLDPGQWLFAGADALDPALRRLIDGPPASELSEMGRAALTETQEWRALRRARAAHRRLVAAAWGRALERTGIAAAADPALAVGAAQARWQAAAEAELDALRAAPAFVASQAALLAAAVRLRVVEQAMIEAWCESRGLPTRREVDDLHRAMAELRREMRALARARSAP